MTTAIVTGIGVVLGIALVWAVFAFIYALLCMVEGDEAEAGKRHE